MNPKYIIAFIAAILLTGCGMFQRQTQPPVVQKTLVPVVINDTSFELPEVPDPIKREDLDPKDPRKNYKVFGDKIEGLLLHIGQLENQILTIHRTMKEQAKRILEDNKK